LIAYFLGNISAKYYENPTMLSRAIAKNIGDVFETPCSVTTTTRNQTTTGVLSLELCSLLLKLTQALWTTVLL